MWCMTSLLSVMVVIKCFYLSLMSVGGSDPTIICLGSKNEGGLQSMRHKF